MFQDFVVKNIIVKKPYFMQSYMLNIVFGMAFEQLSSARYDLFQRHVLTLYLLNLLNGLAQLPYLELSMIMLWEHRMRI